MSEINATNNVTEAAGVTEEMHMQQVREQLNEEELLQENGDITPVFNKETAPDATSQTVDSQEQVQPTLSETELNKTEFTNGFAKIFSVLANVVGKDTGLGMKLQEFAVDIQTQEDVSNGVDGAVLDGAKSGAALGAAVSGAQPAKTLEQAMATQATTQDMASEATAAVRDGLLEDMAMSNPKTDYSNLQSSMRVMGHNLSMDATLRTGYMDSDETDTRSVSENYMDMMRGLKSYNDTALQEIETVYADNPEGKANATKGLGNMMQAAVGTGYDIVLDSNKTFDFLSESDRQELNDMTFAGVTQDFASAEFAFQYKDLQNPAYEAETMLAQNEQTKQIDGLDTMDFSYSEDELMFGEAALDEPVATGAAASAQAGQVLSNEPVIGKGLQAAAMGVQAGRSVSALTSSHAQKVAMVEDAFGDVLTKAEESKSMLDGLER